MTGSPFMMPVRVYYEDTDAGGIVYYANYLKFAERARTEFLRHHDIHQQALIDQAGLAFVVRRVTVDYHSPAALDDLLQVETQMTTVKGASVEMTQRIMRDDTLLITLEVKVACIDTTTGRALRLPVDVRQKFSDMLGRKSHGK